jgi:hypothetical protein
MRRGPLRGLKGHVEQDECDLLFVVNVRIDPEILWPFVCKPEISNLAESSSMLAASPF